MTQKIEGKKLNILGAVSDLVILALLLGGAGFGGYYWGIHQRLAPVQNVPPGTVGALPPPVAQSSPPPKTAAVQETTQSSSTEQASQTAPASTTTQAESSKATKHGKTKYWISSSGADYIGYSITVKVNDTPVDNFFGPGKNVDITNLIKHGDNTVVFEAKALGDQYNKHAGDKTSVLTVQVVKGPHVQEDFKPSDVLLSTRRTAAETEDSSETKNLVGD